MNVKEARQAALVALLDEDAGPVRGRKQRLASRIGKKPAQVSQWLSGYRTIEEETAREIERKAGKPLRWMDDANLAAPPAPHPGEGMTMHPVAHRTNHPEQSDELLAVSWESLVEKVPDRMFVLALRDDALKPDYPRGTAVVWSARRKPAAGRLVLVRDAHGRDHARLYREEKEPGRWTAAATNQAFPSFDPAADRLTVLAVHRGVLNEPDEGE